MPYITKERRAILDEYLNKLCRTMREMNELEIKLEKGDLCYCLFKLSKYYILTKGMKYQNISDACASLLDAEYEIRRRILTPYENKKINDNGDIEWK